MSPDRHAGWRTILSLRPLYGFFGECENRQTRHRSVQESWRGYTAVVDAEARTAALTIFFTLFVVKITTFVMVLMYVPDHSVVSLFLNLNWFWFIPPVVLTAGAGLYWFRLIRMRRRRRELLRQEFTRSSSPTRERGPVGIIRRVRYSQDPDLDILR